MRKVWMIFYPSNANQDMWWDGPYYSEEEARAEAEKPSSSGDTREFHIFKMKEVIK